MKGPLITSIRAPHGDPLVDALLVKGHASADVELAVHLTTADGHLTETVRTAANGAWTARFSFEEASSDALRRGAPVSVYAEHVSGEAGSARWTGLLPNSESSSDEKTPSDHGISPTVQGDAMDLDVLLKENVPAALSASDEQTEPSPSEEAPDDTEEASTSNVPFFLKAFGTKEDERAATDQPAPSEAESPGPLNKIDSLSPPDLPSMMPDDFEDPVPSFQQSARQARESAEDATRRTGEAAKTATDRAGHHAKQAGQWAEQVGRRSAQAARRAPGTEESFRTAPSESASARDDASPTQDAQRSPASPSHSPRHRASDHSGWTAPEKSGRRPTVHFSPVRITERVDANTFTAVVQATVGNEDASGRFEAQLRNVDTGAVLAYEHTEEGALTLRHEGRYASGMHTVAVEILAPTKATGTSTTFFVEPADERSAPSPSNEQQGAVPHSDHEQRAPRAPQRTSPTASTAPSPADAPRPSRTPVRDDATGADDAPSSVRDQVGTAARQTREKAQQTAHRLKAKGHEVNEKAKDMINAERDDQEAAAHHQSQHPSSTYPDVHFRPVEVGSPNEDKTRPVTLEALVKHPFYDPVEASLRDAETGQTLTSDRSEDGRLKLTHTRDYAPGEHAATVEVESPEGCPGTSTSFRVPDASSDTATADDTGESEETENDTEEASSPGLMTRLLGMAWAVVTVLYLLAIAAGSSALFVGASSALLLPLAGLFLGFHPRHWATWTLRGLGAFTLAVVMLLPYTFIVRADGDLLGAALAAVGFILAVVIVKVRS